MCNNGKLMLQIFIKSFHEALCCLRGWPLTLWLPYCIFLEIMYSAFDDIPHAYSTVQVTEYMHMLPKQCGDAFPASNEFQFRLPLLSTESCSKDDKNGVSSLCQRYIVNCTYVVGPRLANKCIDWSGSKPSLPIWEGCHAITNEWNEPNRWTVRQWKVGHWKENETNRIQGLVLVACVFIAFTLTHWRNLFHKPREIMWKVIHTFVFYCVPLGDC
jgi:hypothetical protein